MLDSTSLNIEPYIELLKKETILNNQKKSLLFENKKNVYHSLIAEYLAKTINPGRFRSKFLKMQREDGEAATIIKKDLEQLATFSIPPRSRMNKIS